MKIWKLLRRVMPTHRTFAHFTLAMGLGIILYALGGSKVIRFIAHFPAAINSGFGNWYPDRFERSGLLKYDPARAQSGYTLYTVATDLSTYLIDMDGREVHKWYAPFNVAEPGSSSNLRTLFGLAVRQSEGGTSTRTATLSWCTKFGRWALQAHRWSSSTSSPMSFGGRRSEYITQLMLSVIGSTP
ncbi:MAG: hypothetical protein ACM3TN_10410 [Alphaproteobacteria bacterium]